MTPHTDHDPLQAQARVRHYKQLLVKGENALLARAQQAASAAQAPSEAAAGAGSSNGGAAISVPPFPGAIRVLRAVWVRKNEECDLSTLATLSTPRGSAGSKGGGTGGKGGSSGVKGGGKRGRAADSSPGDGSGKKAKKSDGKAGRQGSGESWVKRWVYQGLFRAAGATEVVSTDRYKYI